MSFGSYNEGAQAIWEFARCQRADGSYYGTRGKCRKGKESGAAEEPAPRTRKRKKREEPAPASAATAPAPEPSRPEAKGKVRMAPKLEKLPKEAPYTPGEVKTQRRGLRQRAKDVVGDVLRKRKVAKEEKELDKMAKENMEGAIKRAKERGASPEAIKKIRESYEKQAVNRRAQRAEEVQRVETVLKGFRKNVPEGATLEKTEQGIFYKAKTKFGDEIRLGWRSDGQLEFSVNGGYDAGTVKDRKAQVATALQVKKLYDAAIKSFPEGFALQVGAWTGDSKEKAKSRSDAYVRMGFSRPEDGEPGKMQYGVVKDGKVYPSDSRGNRIWTYAESYSKSDLEDIKNWHKAIFG